MTLRQASNKARKILAAYRCKIRGKTQSFAGLGFGSAGFVEIECDEALPESAIEEIAKLNAAIRQESPEDKIIFSLGGFAYPFGRTIR